MKNVPWIAVMDGGAICEYCRQQYRPARFVEQQHAKHCPWLEEHRNDPASQQESAWSNAVKQLLQE